MLDRTQAPKFSPITHINFLHTQKQYLDNQLPLYTLRAGEQALLRIEWVFEAGNYYNQKGGQALFTSRMLLEGTKNRTAAQISAAIDQYGAFMEVQNHFDLTEIVLYCPTRFVEQVLPLVAEVIFQPQFPEEELNQLKKRQIQELQINLQKTAFLAGRAFRKAIFGKNNPYGKSIDVEGIEAIERKDLLSFYENHFYQRPFEILVAGKFDEQTLQSINEHFGKFVPIEANAPANSFTIESQVDSFFVEKPESLQNSIRIGKTMMKKTDKDFYRLIVANTILGGYFGSRLMQNIREEKGYTYGIYSSLKSFGKASFIAIATDVNAEFTHNTLQEIYKEIDILQNEKVGEKELQKVKNYLVGNLAASLTTPFAQMDLFKEIHLHHLGYEFYENYIEQIYAVGADEVLEIMQKHYQKDDLIEVVAGSSFSKA
ncbi:MAG: pitrilysin family protein [Raineya sp.]